MKWCSCRCGCGHLIGDDEKFCRQQGEKYRALGFEDFYTMSSAQIRALVDIFRLMIFEDNA
jgi:hypothetical protein